MNLHRTRPPGELTWADRPTPHAANDAGDDPIVLQVLRSFVNGGVELFKAWAVLIGAVAVLLHLFP